MALGALATLGRVCEQKLLEEAVRRETPPSFLTINLDALAAGFRLAQGARLETTH